MSLFANGIVPNRNSRGRSLGGDHLPGSGLKQDSLDDNRHNTGDNHKCSLLSTSTKSTTVDSPPPRCVSFPTNLKSVDKCGVFDHAFRSGMDNPVFSQDTEENSRPCNGQIPRPFSDGTRRGLKQNGTHLGFVAPRVTITIENENKSGLTKDELISNRKEFEKNAIVSNNRLKESPCRPCSPIRSSKNELAPVDG